MGLQKRVAAEQPSLLNAQSALECLVAAGRARGVRLTVAQLIRDNLIDAAAIPAATLLTCCRKAGLDAELVRLRWSQLADLGSTLPVIVVLNNGSAMLLTRTNLAEMTPNVVLRDPDVGDEPPLILDKDRFEAVWSGDVVLIKRSYKIMDETRPFSLSFIAGVVFRDRRVVVDVAIAALAMNFLALTPIMFWRLLGDRVLPFKAMNTFVVVSLVVIILFGFEAAFAALRRYLLLRLTTRADVKLWTYMYDKVLNLPIDYFESTPVGITTHRMSQMSRVRAFLIGQVFGTVLDSSVLLFFVPVMFYFSPMLTFMVLGVGALIVGWIVLMLPPYRRRSSAVETAEALRGAFLSQSVHGMRTIKSLALEARQRHQWDVLSARAAVARLHEGDLANVIQSVVMPFERIMVSGSFAIGVYLAMTTDDPVYIGSLFAFVMLTQRVASPLTNIAQLVQQHDEARIAVESIAALINREPEEGRGGQGVRTPLLGDVEFANVRFKYKGAINPALDGVSFSAPKGVTLGVMGRSGSGKTTVTRLMQRLHSDYQGLIKIDGIDVREYDIDHLRSSLGVVLQDNFLFSGTIRDNITAAKVDATYEDMVYAARLAGAEEFIDKLPRGYETYIYEGSPNLSGGQRQRVAIARTLITNPRILILDEATSALDAESEAIVNANMKRISEGRTTIVISHRLSSLVNSDAILVLDKGAVHDIGRHDELLERCDIYSGLWHQQNGHVAEAANASAKAPKALLGGPSAA